MVGIADLGKGVGASSLLSSLKSEYDDGLGTELLFFGVEKKSSPSSTIFGAFRFWELRRGAEVTVVVDNAALDCRGNKEEDWIELWSLTVIGEGGLKAWGGDSEK